MNAVLKPLCTATELAELIGLSVQRVNQLVAEGVLVRAGKGVFDTIKALRAYIAYKVHDAEDSGSEEYKKARTRLMVAKASKAEAETDLFQGKLADTDVVLELWADRWGKTATKLLAVPTKLAGPLGSEPNIAVRQQMLETEITNALNESAAIDQSEIIAKGLERYGKTATEPQEQAE